MHLYEWRQHYYLNRFDFWSNFLHSDHSIPIENKTTTTATAAKRTNELRYKILQRMNRNEPFQSVLFPLGEAKQRRFAARSFVFTRERMERSDVGTSKIVLKNLLIFIYIPNVRFGRMGETS